MVVGKIGKYFNDVQQARARLILNILEAGYFDPENSQANELIPFYELKDNTCTYAMTGLLMHLLRAIIGGGNCFASSYIDEKIKIIEGEVE